MNNELENLGTVDVYIEGLLVQTRDPGAIMNWAWEDIMHDATQNIVNEIADGFYQHMGSINRSMPWAWHFKNFDAYIIVKVTADSEWKAIVSFSEHNKNSPNMKVVCTLDTHFAGIDFIAALVSLGLYYSSDSLILDSTY